MTGREGAGGEGRERMPERGGATEEGMGQGKKGCAQLEDNIVARVYAKGSARRGTGVQGKRKGRGRVRLSKGERGARGGKVSLIASYLKDDIMARVHSSDGVDGHGGGAGCVGDAGDTTASVEH